MEDLTQWVQYSDHLFEHAVRIAVALVCGLMLGIERERKDKPAGMRTILLITLGAALFMIMSNIVTVAYEWPVETRVDPSRIAAGVVTGIGFLGAGTIIQARGSVHGLTTAAVIWVSAGIGMCAGMGYAAMAFFFTAIVLLTLIAMDPLRHRLARLGNRYELLVIAPNDSLVLERIRYVLLGHDVHDDDVELRVIPEDELEIAFVYFGYGGAALRLLEALARIEGVHGRRTTSE
ncbi:MAG: MgtC/SapB family protein [Rhodothermales bacterium]